MKKPAPERNTYSVRLRPSLIKLFRHVAIEQETPFSALLERAMEEFLAKHGQARETGKAMKRKKDSGR